MTAVADDRYDHLLVAGVVGEHFLETVTQIEERILISYFALEDLGLDYCLATRVDAGGALGILESREAVTCRAGRQEH